ncbi:U4/U6 small nuclear ribonucleoprotein PRP4-like protein [Tanacetum coccineum]
MAHLQRLVDLMRWLVLGLTVGKKHSCFGRNIHKFEPQKGYFLETAYYDMTAISTDFKPVLSDHESKVTYVDVAAAGKRLATVSYDTTITLWSTKNVERYGC